MSTHERDQIVETLARYGHVVDRGDLDRLDTVFTLDVRYDMSAVGLPVMIGVQALADGAMRLGPQNPVAHHTTDVVVLEADEDEAVVESKGFMLTVEGAVRSVSHHDVLRRTAAGWRIASRTLVPQTASLGGRLGAAAGAEEAPARPDR
ncbi:nuclear transport factor 2 family protein [Amnibacterium setariae]|nr:nuclear transport factor 2 family protein [Amnibacterium setariae]